uniref:ATP-dependent DNA helicase n=1 Tax=Amphimedon queenslandica TaxID=400682 RepID=A0A1X7V9I6_AMPQE
MQDEMSSTKYLIIDEMSMVWRKTFAIIDYRLRQAFPAKSQVLFGGCSILLFGDFGHLPPVMDLPIYTTVTRSDLSDQEYRAYSQIETAFTLTQVMRQSAQDSDQVRFCDILMHLRNGDTTIFDAVFDHNDAMLRECGHPISTIKAVHTGSKAPPVHAGLEPAVMLTN